MILRDLVAIAMRALRTNKLRSGLTMLGLIIGVAAVILLTAFGQGLTNSVTAAVAPVLEQRHRGAQAVPDPRWSACQTAHRR